ncbi:MAG: signal recognition particle-docking protein FtsY, partial [Crenarchaeota archaeon]|nr:signal recognition particle-docking protein FtsY [Thermoproteota archaeon]
MFKKLKEAFKSFTNSILSLFREEEKKEEEKSKVEAQVEAKPEVKTETATVQVQVEKPSEEVKVEVRSVEAKPIQVVEEKKEEKVEEKRGFFSRIVHRVAEAVTYTKLSEDKITKLCDNLFIQLVECDVAVEVSEAIVESVKAELANLKIPRFGADKEKLVKECIKRAILKVIEDVPDVDFMELVKKIHEERSPVVILFLGPNGYGKTTTIAKIGYLLKNAGYSVIFAAADTFRAGAIEQLEEHGRRLGIRVIKHRYGADPAAVIHDAI